jgi:hypothetical protein
MTPDDKPEWFQISDADNAASPRKISKGLPIMAILAVAAIIGIGTVVTQTQDEAPANATETVAPAVSSDQSSATLSSLTPAKGSQDNESVAPSSPIIKSSVTPTASSTPGITNPIGKKPSGGEHEGNEHEGNEHEGGGEDD